MDDFLKLINERLCEKRSGRSSRRALLQAGVNVVKQSVFKVILQKVIPTQIRQFILRISNSKEYVDIFVGELTSANRRYKHFS